MNPAVGRRKNKSYKFSAIPLAGEIWTRANRQALFIQSDRLPPDDATSQPELRISFLKNQHYLQNKTRNKMKPSILFTFDRKVAKIVTIDSCLSARYSRNLDSGRAACAYLKLSMSVVEDEVIVSQVCTLHSDTTFKSVNKSNKLTWKQIGKQ